MKRALSFSWVDSSFFYFQSLPFFVSRPSASHRPQCTHTHTDGLLPLKDIKSQKKPQVKINQNHLDPIGIMAFQWHPSAQYKALKPKFWESISSDAPYKYMRPTPKATHHLPPKICFISWPIPGDMSTRLSVFTSFVVDEEKKIQHSSLYGMLTVFFFFLLSILIVRWTEWKTFFFFSFYQTTTWWIHFATGPHTQQPEELYGRERGKKKASRRVQKKDFLLYSSSLMERMRGFLAGATSTPIAYYKFFRVVVGGKKRKVKQRSLSGMNDPRCIFTDRSDNNANSPYHLLRI